MGANISVWRSALLACFQKQILSKSIFNWYHGLFGICYWIIFLERRCVRLDEQTQCRRYCFHYESRKTMDRRNKGILRIGNSYSCIDNRLYLCKKKCSQISLMPTETLSVKIRVICERIKSFFIINPG